MTATGFFAVGFGAAFGAWLRWTLSHFLNGLFPLLPLGTLAANLVGGFLVGVALEFFGARAGLSPELRLFAVTGFLGGLTTFSTFSAEAVILLRSDQTAWALTHIGTHLVGSIVLTMLGIATARYFTA
jgi:CrcB protein